jgi:2-polyprenyl-6-methoxyphenol hydroxylase-like FAD-dependent oxidoreductase
MYADDPDDMSTWTMAWIKIWRRSRLPEPPAKKGHKALAYIKATSEDVIEPFRSQMEWTRESDGCYIDEMRTWVPVMWDTHGGRITLAGDAAHPMLVYRGQGFQHAVADAERYVQALVSVLDGGVNREEALRAYTTDVVERGAKAVTQSLSEAELSMDLESVKKSLVAKMGHARSA